jgi:hypothetical protein
MSRKNCLGVASNNSSDLYNFINGVPFDFFQYAVFGMLFPLLVKSKHGIMTLRFGSDRHDLRFTPQNKDDCHDLVAPSG